MNRILIIQPALPTYRVPFFSKLSSIFGADFKVFSSQGGLGVLSEDSSGWKWSESLGESSLFLRGFYWQSGALSVGIEKGDVVVLPGNPRILSNLALLVKAKLRGARVVCWGHYWSASSRPWGQRIRAYLMRYYDGLLFYTDDEVKEYILRYGAKQKQSITALNNGIETSAIKLLRRPYIAAERESALFFIGRLTKKARVSELLYAMAELSRNDLKLHIVGSGEELGGLLVLAEALGVADRVEWHGGITDETMICEIANKCRAFVYPGEVGLSLIHSMAYGLPSIVHSDRWAQMPEYAAFENGVTGVCFRPGDSNDLARVISEAWDDPERLERWSEACCERTTTSFNVDDMVRRFVRMVSDLDSRP